MTEGIFCLLLRECQKQDKKLEVQLFLSCLLVPLALVGRPRSRLVLKVSALGLAVSLTIGKAESMGGKVVIGFSG